jgi:membrane protein
MATTKTQEPRETPTEVGARGWWSALKRVRPRMKQLNIGLLAAGVAFWALLSIFPSVIALVTVYGLFSDPEDVTEQVDNALSALSEDAQRAIGGQLESVASARSGALSFGLVISLAVVLWAASAGIQNLMQALSTSFEQEETRGFVKLKATAIVFSIGAIIFGAVMVAFIGVIPRVLENIFGTGPLRWLILVAEAILLFVLLVGVISVLYRFLPANAPAGWRWASGGAVFAALVLLLFTGAFAFYVNNFGNYNKTYGALAGVVILMLWMYYSTYVVLIGALVNAEGQREVKENAEAEPEQVDRDVVRSPNEERKERELRPPTR